jgi:two-component system, NtrC family, sensor histidine kinase HydH
MNRKLLMQLTAPSVVTGFVLFLACLVSVLIALRVQRGLNTTLSQDVASVQAAQELEIRVRQLCFRNLLNLVDPLHARLEPVDSAHRDFEKALDKARQAVNTQRERDAVEAIAAGYQTYQRELALLAAALNDKSDQRPDLHKLVDAHHVRTVVEPCQNLVQISREQIADTMQKNDDLSQWLRFGLLGLGVIGPLSGVLGGYSVARGLSRHIYQLNVRVQDMAKHLDQTVAAVTLPPGAGLHYLDRQLQYVVQRVQEAAENLQRQQRDLLRAEQLAAVGQLAASVAHEVRNPLTSIKLLIEAASRPHKSRPLTPEDLEVIHREIVRLEGTVQSFLDFARPPALRRVVCDFRQVVAQAAELVTTRARQQGVTIDVRTPCQPVMAAVDQGQFATVLVNLFLNALDAMPEGGHLQIQLEATPSGGLILTVTDTGSGIAPQILNRLFTPFASDKSTGTGLGLSISKRIIEGHGGRIAAENRPEGGARFCITLIEPAAAIASQHGQQPAACPAVELNA